jgi:hypothetical protein
MRLMPSIRLASAILVVGNAILAFFAYREYQSLLDYCEGSPEVVAGGDRFSCLEPQHWFTVGFGLLVALLLEVALLVVVGVAVVHWRSTRYPNATVR